jgi:hypothetical protein
LVARELRESEKFAKWFQEHKQWTIFVSLLALTNVECLSVVGCRVGGLAFLSAPWGAGMRPTLEALGVLTNLLEDAPQVPCPPCFYHT